MAVPDFQTIMLPLLQLTSDQQEHSLSEAIESLAEYFSLSDKEFHELLPSGRQGLFYNRVGWASTYLKKAQLLESTRRGWFHITQRGYEVLRADPEKIDRKYLEQFPEYLEFRVPSYSESDSSVVIETEGESTPEESLETSYNNIQDKLASELLEQIHSCSPAFFERMVVDLLVTMGYGGSRLDAGKAVGRTNDGGIDGIINEDRLGLDVVYIQAKRWQNTVGRPEVQSFAGSLEGVRARKGIFITTSDFSQAAWDYVTRIEKKIVLIDGKRLANLMIEHGVGVTKVAEYVINRVDIDYFTDD
jgi:restriction system protein